MVADRVPELGDHTVYSDWKRRVKIWTISTKTDKKKMAAVLICHMRGKPESAAIQLDIDQLTEDDGVDKLLKEMDKLYEPDSTQQIFNALDEFLHYKRPSEATMEEYCRDFSRKLKMLEQKSGKTGLFDDGVLAYYLLQNSNLDSNSMVLIRATVSELKLHVVEAALKKTFGRGAGQSDFKSGTLGLTHIKQEGVYYGSSQSSSETDDQSGYCSSASEHGRTGRLRTPSSEDENKTYFTGKGKYQTKKYNNHKRSGRDQNRYEPYKDGKNPRHQKNFSPERRKSPYKGPDKGKRRTACFFCDEEGHRVADCPKKRKYKDSKTSDQFFQSFVNVNECDAFLNETYNGALLDSGASATVCGRKWLEAFESHLSEEERLALKEEECFQTFRFGDGDPIVCRVKKNLPVNICGRDIMLYTYVVEGDVPLLLSRATMKKMECKLDFVRDEVHMFGKTEKLIISRSGHMIIPFKGIREELKPERSGPTISQSATFVVETDDPKKNANHLHRYFAHASSKKIKEMVKDSSLPQKTEICDHLDKIEKSCEQCLQRKSKQIPHRKVALPSGTRFNDRVAMDLKQLDSGEWILHVIDTVTRFCMACKVDDKGAEEILTKLFRIWITVFGRPTEFLSDNGGEFANQEFNEMCQLYDVEVRTSPAESPWCNGVVERHNAILGKMIESVREETGCNLETAICWSVSAKNCLSNVQGFSPNQLVFGQNPSVPGLLDDHLNFSTLNTETASKILADNNNARTVARKKFVELENDSCLKRALKERVYEGRNKEYKTGDQVYFKREKSKNWHGPARVVGQLDNVVIVKHGGLLYRVHPCKIVMKTEADSQINSYKIEDHEKSAQNLRKAEDRGERSGRSYSAVDHLEDSDSEDEVQTVMERVETTSPAVSGTNNVQRPTGNQSHLEERDQRPLGEQSHVGDERPVDQLELVNSAEGSEDSQLQNTWTDVSVSSGKLNLRKDDVIRYRAEPTDDWTSGIILGRAGKATGRYKNEFNVVTEDEDNPVTVKLDNVSVEVQSVPSVYHLVTDINMKDPAVLKAKEAEIKRFKEFDVFEEVKDHEQPTVSSRWVITSKEEGTYKARLVARGFQELNENQSDAPTADRISKRLMFTIAACRNWEIKALDITSAFLQADVIKRDVFVKPPADIRRKGIIWKLKKPLYGLGDSARNWYMTLRDKLVETGCYLSKLDQSVFRFYDDRNCLAGILVSHVDDLLYAGNTKFHREIMKQVLSCFKISRMHTRDFTYLGWSIEQRAGCITVDQQDYGLSIEPITHSSKVSKDKERTLSESEKSSYQGTLGKLLWLSGQTRPDLSYDTMELSTYTSSAKVKHLTVMNKVIKKIKTGPSQIRFNAMDLDRGDIKVIFYSDASLGNLPNKTDSGRGYLVFVSDGYNANLIAWSANKIRRTVHSVFGAETIGCVDGIAAAIYVRQILSEILYNDPKKTVIPIVGYIDSNQLAQQIKSTKQPVDMRMRLDIAGIRESVNTGEIESISWISTKEMLADPLTKKNADIRLLKQVLESGHF